jgi:hypothetical protein
MSLQKRIDALEKRTGVGQERRFFFVELYDRDSVEKPQLTEEQREALIAQRKHDSIIVVMPGMEIPGFGKVQSVFEPYCKEESTAV